MVSVIPGVSVTFSHLVDTIINKAPTVTASLYLKITVIFKKTHETGRISHIRSLSGGFFPHEEDNRYDRDDDENDSKRNYGRPKATRVFSTHPTLYR